MASLPRGTCQVCGRSVPVRRNGTTREHRPDPSSVLAEISRRTASCPGSGARAESPREATGA